MKPKRKPSPAYRVTEAQMGELSIREWSVRDKFGALRRALDDLEKQVNKTAELLESIKIYQKKP